MNFLDNYLKYCESTEPHELYHKFSGLFALSCVMSRRVWVDMGRFKHYPNLYIILVGSSGNRKTTAMSVAKHMIHSLEFVPMSAEAITKEKLILDMEETERVIEVLHQSYPDQSIESPMNCFSTELTQFFGFNAAHMIDFLTTVYDQDYYDSRIKNGKSVRITGPFLNLIGCTTPENITMYLKANVLSSGFGRRAIFVYTSERGNRIPFPQVTPEQQQAYDSCVQYLKLTPSKIHGPFRWEPEAHKYVYDWYMSHEIPEDQYMAGYYESKQAQLIKLAMIYAISDNHSMTLKLTHLQSAMSLLNEAEKTMGRVFAGVGRNELVAIASTAKEIILTQPSLTLVDSSGPKTYAHAIEEKRLTVRLFPTGEAREITEVIQHLIDSGFVKKINAATENSKVSKIWLVKKTKE